MIKIKILIFCILVIFFNNTVYSNIKIIYKINNEIITSVDIQNEINYLIALNDQLSKLDENKLISIAKESIVRERIKKSELVKYFVLDQKNPLLKKIIKNFWIKLNVNNEEEFIEYLKLYNLTIEKVLEKIEIETTWNQLIYDRYKNQIKINKNEIEKNLKSNPKKEETVKYLLSEILFENKDNNTLEIKFLKIEQSINEIGFKNTATTYSIADSAKFGGNIGWVNEFNLSKKIVGKIKDLKIGEITKPILVGSNYIVIKLDNIKNELVVSDNKKNLEELIVAEKNRQLNQFSNIYYNKVKINTYINEQ